jgi:hypothetical protein
LRRGLLEHGYDELPITGEHAVALDGLPPIHKDPFDRMLIVQSMVEGITLLTADPLIAQYPAPIRMATSAIAFVGSHLKGSCARAAVIDVNTAAKCRP